MRVVLLVVAALALAGCEADGRPSRLLGSAADGFARGYGDGSATVQQTPTKPDQSPPLRMGVFCPLKSEYVSGQNRICNYDCAGSANPVTKKSYESCGGGFMKY